MTYIEQLNSKEWQNKRTEILSRDKHKCTECLNQSYIDNFKQSIASKGSINDDYCLFDISTEKKSVFISKELKIYKNEIVVYYNESPNSTFLHLAAIREKTKYDECIDAERYINEKPEIYKNAILTILNIKIEDYENRNNIGLNNFKWLFVKDIHIHHTYYQINKLAWQYPNDALTTLCWQCHENLHKNVKVPFLDEFGVQIGSLNPCSKCYGAGWFPEYSHVQNGICFKCNGNKYDELTHNV